MQIKAAVRYYYIPMSMTGIQNTNNTKCVWRCGTIGTLIHSWWVCKMAQPLWETVWWFLTELNILLPCGPAVTLLSIYPKWLKTYVLTKTCSWMFIIAGFVIEKSWKQGPRCASVGESINKLWSIHTVEYDSSLFKKKGAIQPWKDIEELKCILSEKKLAWKGYIP